jgi:hypothetical protein
MHFNRHQLVTALAKYPVPTCPKTEVGLRLLHAATMLHVMKLLHHIYHHKSYFDLVAICTMLSKALSDRALSGII